MISLTATEARKSFFDMIKQSNQKHEIIELFGSLPCDNDYDYKKSRQ